MTPMHAWYSALQAAVGGTWRYKAHDIPGCTRGNIVNVTMVSADPRGPAWPDAVYLGTVGDFVSSHASTPSGVPIATERWR